MCHTTSCLMSCDCLLPSGLKSEVALYNLLLQVYLLNEYHFSPSKVIEEMKACDVSPNQVSCAAVPNYKHIYTC